MQRVVTRVLLYDDVVAARGDNGLFPNTKLRTSKQYSCQRLCLDCCIIHLRGTAGGFWYLKESYLARHQQTMDDCQTSQPVASGAHQWLVFDFLSSSGFRMLFLTREIWCPMPTSIRSSRLMVLVSKRPSCIAVDRGLMNNHSEYLGGNFFLIPQCMDTVGLPYNAERAGFRPRFVREEFGRVSCQRKGFVISYSRSSEANVQPPDWVSRLWTLISGSK